MEKKSLGFTILLCILLGWGNTVFCQTTLPADVYRLAGQAKREAGVVVYGHLWCTWINWHPEKYTSPLAREVVDGYCMMMSPEGADTSIDQWYKARLAICESGIDFDVIPGVRVSPDSYEGWRDPNEWLKDYEFARKVLELTGSKRLYCDTEAYANKDSKKYPYLDITYDMFDALGPWKELLKGIELHQTPGGADYIQSMMLGRLAQKSYMYDQYTFNRMSEDGSELKEIIRKRKAWCDAQGFVYVPGVYARHLVNPQLYVVLKESGVKRIWCFWQAKEDDYSNFGTLDWVHVQ